MRPRLFTCLDCPELLGEEQRGGLAQLVADRALKVVKGVTEPSELSRGRDAFVKRSGGSGAHCRGCGAQQEQPRSSRAVSVPWSPVLFLNSNTATLFCGWGFLGFRTCSSSV